MGVLSLILICLSLVSGTPQASDTLLPPACLIAADEQDSRVPLYWFKPGSQPYELAYDDGTKEHQFYVSGQWAENKAALQMSSPVLPFALLKSKVFISYQGAKDDTLYDFTAPFLISVNQDSSGFPGRLLWGPFSANATGLDSANEDGEWVEFTNDLMFEDDSCFWVVFHWKEDTPTSPLIGEDSSTNSGRCLYYSLNDYGYFEWREWAGYNFMIRSVIVTHDSADISIALDGFKIYRSEENDFSLSLETLTDSVGGDQFSYVDYGAGNGQNYFYKLTSVYAGEESDPSNEVEATPKRGADLLAGKDLIEVSLDTNQSQLDYVNVSNKGGIPLDIEIRIDLSLNDSTAGVDHFGYTWTDNRKTEGLAFDWVDITDDGVLLNQGGSPEYVYGPVALDFSFPFYGAEYDSLWVTLNGCLCFRHVGLLKWVNDSLPNPHTHLNLIAPFWSNLWFDESTEIYYYSRSDSLVVSFIDIKHFVTGSGFTFQAILTEKGEIDFQYKEIEDSSASATVGLQNDDGSCGLLISCNQDYLQDSLRVKIVPGWIAAEPREGEIAPGENLAVNLLFDSDFLEVGEYSASLNIDGRDKNRQLDPLSISVILNVESPADTTSDTTITDTTSVAERGDESMLHFVLQQNYPNPFNPRTTIPFRITSPQVNGSRFMVHSPLPISLKIYNIRGELVRILANEKKISGDYQVTWDGKNEKGKDVASGIYFYKLKAGDFSETKKMILLK